MIFLFSNCWRVSKASEALLSVLEPLWSSVANGNGTKNGSLWPLTLYIVWSSLTVALLLFRH